MNTTTAEPAVSAILADLRAQIASGAARETRIRARLSGAELARDIPVTPSVFRRWENGEVSPRGEKALRYAELLADLKTKLAPVAA